VPRPPAGPGCLTGGKVYLVFSFLCTFIPGSEKTIERTFALVELSFRGTFAPGERKVQELSLHRTFATVELSLHKQLSCPLTFAPVATCGYYGDSCVRQSCEATLTSDNYTAT